MREAYNDPDSLRSALKKAPTEANMRAVMRGFEAGVTLAERALLKRRAKAIMLASFGCTILLCADLSLACLFAVGFPIELSASDPNVLAASLLTSVLPLLYTPPPSGGDGGPSVAASLSSS